MLNLQIWLTNENSPPQLYQCLDVRELTPKNQTAFLAAIEPAYSRRKERGPAGLGYPQLWESFLALFKNLAEQVELLAQGNTPGPLPYLSGVAKYDGRRSGPGWDDPDAPPA